MQTVRQMEKMWTARQYARLFRELSTYRPEGPLVVQLDATAIAAAAMAIIRLDELDLTHLPFYRTLLHVLLDAQDADGGWDNPALTALCTRALMVSNGKGSAIDRALGYLAHLQKSEGTWPSIPIRRTDADTATSLFILYHLGRDERFHTAVDLPAAVAWFTMHFESLDHTMQKIWNRIQIRLGTVVPRRVAGTPLLEPVRSKHLVIPLTCEQTTT